MTTIKVGDFLSETLVTDTLVWEVVRATDKTITVRSTIHSDIPAEPDTTCGTTPNGLGVYWHRVEPNQDGSVRTLRLRKDGTYRIASWSRPLRVISGIPRRRVDYRM